MTFLEQQTALLEKLANVLFNSFDGRYDELGCEYEFLADYDTISTSFYTVIDGNQTYYAAEPGTASKSIDICEDLRALIKDHTGTAWQSLTLTLDANGRAHTKFHYPD